MKPKWNIWQIAKSDFLGDRKQRVVLNGKCSFWMNVQPGVSQGSALRPLCFKIYINDLPDNVTSNPKLFPEEFTSLFSTTTDPSAMANRINNDLRNINTCTYQLKINLILILVNEHRRLNLAVKQRLLLILSLLPMHETSTQKHLGMFLDFKLNFQEYFENMLNTLDKTIAVP